MFAGVSFMFVGLFFMFFAQWSGLGICWHEGG